MIIFRTDSSSLIGSGHVTRCISLASYLKKDGLDVEFICRKHKGNYINKIQDAGFKVHELKLVGKIKLKSNTSYASWLGASQSLDAENCIEIIKSRKINFLIVDHYGIGVNWQKKLKPYCGKLMVIDDLAQRRHACDVILNQNLGSTKKKYKKLIPHTCKQLLGPKFALLDSVYSNIKVDLKSRSGNIRRALIYFGGGDDALKYSELALNAFCEPKLIHIKLDLVINSKKNNLKQIKKIISNRGRIKLYSNLPNLSKLISNSDLAIGAAGSTTWERCCFGIPSIIVICALNQKLSAEKIKKKNAAFVFYPNNNLQKNIKDAALSLCRNKNIYLKMSQKALKICDGHGSKRVSKLISQGSL